MLLTTLMGLKSISCSDVSNLLPQRQTMIIDVNSASRWADAHVPGARNLDPERFGDADLAVEKDTGLVFYCSNPFCRKAPNAARRAKTMGYTNVRVMSAGIQGWIDQQLPVDKAG